MTNRKPLIPSRAFLTLVANELGVNMTKAELDAAWAEQEARQRARALPRRASRYARRSRGR